MENEESLQRPLFCSVPVEWMRSPVFRPSPSSYSVAVLKTGAVWEVGVANPVTIEASPRLSWFNLRVLFAVMHLLAEKNLPASLRQVCESMAMDGGDSVGSIGGRRMADIAESLAGLSKFWMSRKSGEEAVSFPLLRVNLPEGKRRTIGDITLDPALQGLIKSAGAPLRFDVVRRLQSFLAGALYLYMPARAAMREDKASPAEITLKTLSTQIGFPTSSALKKALTQNAVPILSQLDGLPMSHGYFHIRLEEGTKLQMWREPGALASIRRESKLRTAFLKGGGKREAFQAYGEKIELSDDEWAQCLRVGFDASYKRFLQDARFLLMRNGFVGILGFAERQFANSKKSIASKPAVVSTMFSLAAERLGSLTSTGNFDMEGNWWVPPIEAHIAAGRKAAAKLRRLTFSKNIPAMPARLARGKMTAERRREIKRYTAWRHKRLSATAGDSGDEPAETPFRVFIARYCQVERDIFSKLKPSPADEGGIETVLEAVRAEFLSKNRVVTDCEWDMLEALLGGTRAKFHPADKPRMLRATAPKLSVSPEIGDEILF